MSDRTERDVAAVRAYLEASMRPDPVAAAAHVAPEFLCRFTGNREFTAPDGPTSVNAARYSWVKKRIDRYDAMPDGARTVVYCTGHLHGAWPDGTPFDHNRFVDRFVVEDGLILETDVWNDSAEWLLDPSLSRR